MTFSSGMLDDDIPGTCADQCEMPMLLDSAASASHLTCRLSCVSFAQYPTFGDVLSACHTLHTQRAHVRGSTTDSYLSGRGVCHRYTNLKGGKGKNKRGWRWGRGGGVEGLIEDAHPGMHLRMPIRMQTSSPRPTIYQLRRLLVAFLFDIEVWVDGSKSS